MKKTARIATLIAFAAVITGMLWIISNLATHEQMIKGQNDPSMMDFDWGRE